MQTLAVAAIVLVVLVIVISIFINKTGEGTEILSDCSAKFPEASCMTKDACVPDAYLNFGRIGCPDKDNPDNIYCCAPK